MKKEIAQIVDHMVSKFKGSRRAQLWHTFTDEMREDMIDACVMDQVRNAAVYSEVHAFTMRDLMDIRSSFIRAFARGDSPARQVTRDVHARGQQGRGGTVTRNNLQSEEIAQIVDRLVSTFIGHMHKVIGTVAMEELPADVINNETCMRIADRAVQRLAGPMREAVPTEAQHKAAEAEAEALRLQTFGPDKILGPEYAEHIQGVVIRAINRHAKLGIVRERIADAVAEALTGKQMRPENSQSLKSFAEMLWEP